MTKDRGYKTPYCPRCATRRHKAQVMRRDSWGGVQCPKCDYLGASWDALYLNPETDELGLPDEIRAGLYSVARRVAYR